MLLAGRQKRIKLADRSEYGWAVVDEYEDDELALDEDDAKGQEGSGCEGNETEESYQPMSI